MTLPDLPDQSCRRVRAALHRLCEACLRRDYMDTTYGRDDFDPMTDEYRAALEYQAALAEAEAALASNE